ncbi:hypothetical protein [Lacunimicrobium album]
MIRGRTLARWCSCLAAGNVIAATAWLHAADPVYTNNTQFRIPYHFDAVEMSRLGAKEIHLYGSENRGQDWKLLQAVPPKKGKFEFKSEKQGEFWFAVKTQDQQGQLHPNGNKMEPGLIVRIDTILPTLELTIKETQPGRVELSWTAADESLDLTSLVLESKDPLTNQWQTVNVVASAVGRTSWSVAKPGQVQVRGKVKDLAGNLTTTEKTLNANQAGTDGGKPYVPDFTQPIAESPSEGSLAANNNDFKLPYPQAGMPKPNNGMTPPSLSSNNGMSNHSLPNGVNSNSGNPNGMMTNNGMPLIAGQQSMPTPMMQQNYPHPQSGGGHELPSWPSSPLSSQPAPSLTPPAYGAGQFVSSNEAAAPDITKGRYSTPNQTMGYQPKVKTVASSRFQIDYRLEDVGPSGVSAVELFITADGGQQWWRYGEDPDRMSPFEVEVPNDGTYGFAIRAKSGVGAAHLAPRQGDVPSMQVLVDQTAPDIAKLTAQQGVGATMNQITLNWNVTDAQLADRPVSLSYSGQPSGPWEPLTGWNDNTSQYVWTVNQNVPHQLYFRIAARDVAGNIAYQQTQHPVLIDLSQPSAHILDIETLPTQRPY